MRTASWSKTHGSSVGSPVTNFNSYEGASCGSDARPLHFTGKERGQESGLDYFDARFQLLQFGPLHVDVPTNQKAGSSSLYGRATHTTKVVINILNYVFY